MTLSVMNHFGEFCNARERKIHTEYLADYNA